MPGLEVFGGTLREEVPVRVREMLSEDSNGIVNR